jgi:hypothetical protein
MNEIIEDFGKRLRKSEVWLMGFPKDILEEIKKIIGDNAPVVYRKTLLICGGRIKKVACF